MALTRKCGPDDFVDADARHAAPPTSSDGTAHRGQRKVHRPGRRARRRVGPGCGGRKQSWGRLGRPRRLIVGFDLRTILRGGDRVRWVRGVRRIGAVVVRQERDVELEFDGGHLSHRFAEYPEYVHGPTSTLGSRTDAKAEKGEPTAANRGTLSSADVATGTDVTKAVATPDETKVDEPKVVVTPVGVTPADGTSVTDVATASKSEGLSVTASQPVTAASVQSQPVVEAPTAQLTPIQAKTAAVVATQTVAADHTPSVVADTQPPAPLAAVDTVAPASPPAPPRIGFVSGLVSGVLTAVGLNPHAADGPTTPAEPPMLWALLGWVRRELGQMIDPSPASTATATATTSLIVGPSASTFAAVPAVNAAPAVSVLGTPQQLEAERIAASTVDTLPVALLKLVLRFGFQSAAQQQFSLVGGNQANLDQLGAAIDEYATATAFQQQILNSNDPTLVAQVGPPHTWYGQMVGGSRILYDNPDTIYRFAGVNAASSYVITGRFSDPKPAETTFSVLTGLNGITTSVLNAKDLQVNDDGTFTITASRDPANGDPNHLQLPNDATLIATRNTLGDWNSEDPISLQIKRVGGPPNSLFSQLGGFAIPGLGPLVVGNPLLTALVSLVPPLADPSPLLRGVVTAVIMALGIQREATYIAVATTDPVTGERIQPNVLKSPTRNAEFLATQLQSAGYFQLADDEALVVTIDPGNAGYFVLPVTNDRTISRDYWNEQTSLNKAQSIIDQGSTKYTVVSKTDPGVANWVSTGGLNQGTISMRFQALDSAAPDDLPTVTSQVVKLNQLDSVLPAGTVLYSEARRQQQLATRKAGFDRRFAPFPQP